MHWQLTEEQDAYQETLRDWLASVAPSDAVRGWLDDADPTPFTARFETDGWWGVGQPESGGGQGGGLVELALTAEELARVAAPSSLWLAAAIAAPALAGLERAALLVPAETIPHLAPALEVDDNGLVSGSVPRVLAAGEVSTFAVPVLVDGELRLARVDAQEARIVPRSPLDRSRTMGDVALESIAVDLLDIDAVPALEEASARAAVLIAADALGASQRMLDLAVEYAGQRRQFGVPIGSFQAVKHAAATMLVGIEAARSIVLFAAASCDQSRDDRDGQWLLHAAAAKSQVTAEAARAADSALIIHGAVGYTWEHDLQLFYKRANLDRELHGRPEAWDSLIADGLDLTVGFGQTF